MSALDDHVREAVSRVLESLRERLGSELGSLQDELAQSAQQASARIAADAAEDAKAEVRRDADREIAEIRETAAREAEQQRTQLAAEIEDLQRRIDESQAQIEAAGRDTDTARQEAESERDRAETARAAAVALTHDLESARDQLEATREDVEATLRDIEQVRRESDAAREELRQLGETLRRKDERAAQAARLPEAVRVLDQAATFGGVLESLVESASREAGRAAVFLVKGARLRESRTVGFHFASDQPRLDIALSDSGPMTEAVRSGERVRYAEDSLPDFARGDEARDGAAWPISVGGSVVAVLYADGPAADKPDELYWPAFLDVLAKHAGRVLEGITVRQAAGLMTGRPAGLSRSSPVSHQSSGSLQ